MLFRNITFSLISLLLVACNDHDSKIYGTWDSDGERTWNYLQKHANLTEEQETSLKTLFGNATVTYNPDGTGVMDFPSYNIAFLDSESIEIEAFNESFTYEIVGESESQIVIKLTSELPLIDDYPYSLIRFEDNNTYSVSLNDSISDLAGREFFVRTN